MSRCYVADVPGILNDINNALVVNKQKPIKKNDWHMILSAFTPNKIKPHWINECFRKSPFEELNAKIVKISIEEHLASIDLNRDVHLTSSED
jgi:hypothetical protein